MAQNRNEPLPAFILNAPELTEVDVPYFDAFVILDGTRHQGLGSAGSIPWYAILQYGHYLELDQDDLDEFIEIITLTDNFVLQKVQEEQDKK